LISQTGDACIADFGLSELVIEGHDPRHSTPWYVAGHPRWKAPEMIRAETNEEARRTKETDIFAYGRVMLEVHPSMALTWLLHISASLLQLFTRDIPFFYISQDGAVALTVMRGDLPEKPIDKDIISRGLDDEMWGLMTHCWDPEPSKRPDAKFVLRRLRDVVKLRGEKGSSTEHHKRARSESEDSEDESRMKKPKTEEIYVKDEEF